MGWCGVVGRGKEKAEVGEILLRGFFFSGFFLSWRSRATRESKALSLGMAAAAAAADAVRLPAAEA